jgi:hypothetical protein
VKRVAVVVCAGLALAVVFAAQALKAPERQPVLPIELPAPATHSADEHAEAPAGEEQSSRGISGPATRRQAPATHPRPSSPPPSADDGRPLSTAPEQSAPPPAPRSDDGDDDPADDEDSRGDDDAGADGDNAGDD